VAAHLSPTREPRLVELTVSYRTPAEVVAVAARVLAVAAPGVSPRVGPPLGRRTGARGGRSGGPGGRVAEVAAAEVSAVEPGRTAVLAPPLFSTP